MQSAAAAYARLCDPEARVSAHWLIDENGTITALVDEERRAWHAGVSTWLGESDLNARSIGIEIVNPGHEWGYRAFPEAQVLACIWLAQSILSRWPVNPRRIVAHSDIAPLRKQDPGELFPWPRLAAAGIGLWPEDGPGLERPLRVLQEQLVRIGYGLTPSGTFDNETRLVLIAFQRHFRPERVDGTLDHLTRARLDGLLAMIGEA